MLHLPIPLALLDGVLQAAHAEGATVVRGQVELLQLKATSARTELLRRMEALLPQVPTPSLREEVQSVFSLIRSCDPLAKISAVDSRLHELEIKLMAEERAQTDSSLRGPRPVFGADIKALVDEIARLMS